MAHLCGVLLLTQDRSFMLVRLRGGQHGGRRVSLPSSPGRSVNSGMLCYAVNQILLPRGCLLVGSPG